MRIVQNMPDLLIVRDRATLPVLAILVIALVFAVLGGGAVLYGDDRTTQLVGLCFALIAPALVGLAAYIAQEHTHIFDRRAGVLRRRVRRVIGSGETWTIPLDHVRGVEMRVEHEVADPDTYGLDLLIARDGGAMDRAPLRHYTSSADLSAQHATIERWLAARA